LGFLDGEKGQLKRKKTAGSSKKEKTGPIPSTNRKRSGRRGERIEVRKMQQGGIRQATGE